MPITPSWKHSTSACRTSCRNSSMAMAIGMMREVTSAMHGISKMINLGCFLTLEFLHVFTNDSHRSFNTSGGYRKGSGNPCQPSRLESWLWWTSNLLDFNFVIWYLCGHWLEEPLTTRTQQPDHWDPDSIGEGNREVQHLWAEWCRTQELGIDSMYICFEELVNNHSNTHTYIVSWKWVHCFNNSLAASWRYRGWMWVSPSIEGKAEIIQIHCLAAWDPMVFVVFERLILQRKTQTLDLLICLALLYYVLSNASLLHMFY